MQALELVPIQLVMVALLEIPASVAAITLGLNTLEPVSVTLALLALALAVRAVAPQWTSLR